MYLNKKENFSVIPEWPFLPPTYYTTKNYKHWEPWFYRENGHAVYPVIPSIVNYHPLYRRFPPNPWIREITTKNGDNNIPLIKPTAIVEEEFNSKNEDSPKINIIKTNNMDINKIIVVIIIIGIMYYVLTK